MGDHRQARPTDMSTAVERAYLAIRAGIVDGSLEAGSALKEADLADRIGVSRTPIRDALNRLRAEGLVVLESYRKNYVARFDEKSIREIFEIRSVLESYAAARAAQHITSEQLDRLDRTASEMEAVVKARDEEMVRRFSDLNAEFHLIILEACDSPRLEAMMASLTDMPLALLQRFLPKLPDYLERSCQHHREIINALRTGNPLWAASQMFAHVLSSSSTQI